MMILDDPNPGPTAPGTSLAVSNQQAPNQIATDVEFDIPPPSITDLIKLGDGMFHDMRRTMFMRKWQELAEEFYPERANFFGRYAFTTQHVDYITDNTPWRNRRDLANALSILLRPDGQKWFLARPKDEWRKNEITNAWLDAQSDVMRNYVYSKNSNFRVQWNLGDNDFVVFGNAVTAMTENSKGNGFKWETFHLRDCAWEEDEDGVVNHLHRQMQIPLAKWRRMFGAHSMTEGMLKTLKTNPSEQETIHVACLPVDEFDMITAGKIQKRRTDHKFIMVYYDPKQKKALKTRLYHEFPYIVRRWFRTEGPYGDSPAAMHDLVNARMLQAQSGAVLDATELAVNPPMLASQEFVSGDVLLRPGAVNWVSANYDQKLGDAIRPLVTGANLPVGLETIKDTREQSAATWYINKLSLPATTKDMTAYEVEQILEEYNRSIKPVVQPFQDDNKQALDLLFTALMRKTQEIEGASAKLAQMQSGMPSPESEQNNLLADLGIEQAAPQIYGPFSPLAAIPPKLRDEWTGELTDLDFEFDGPLEIAYRKIEAGNIKRGLASLGEIAKLKPDVVDNVDIDTAVRDALQADSFKSKYLYKVETVEKKRAQMQAKQAQAEKLAMAEKMSSMAGNAAKALPAVAGAMQGGAMGKGGGAQPGAPGQPGQGMPQLPAPQPEQPPAPFDLDAEDIDTGQAFPMGKNIPELTPDVMEMIYGAQNR